MRAKKAAKQSAQISIGSNGILKKKKKQKSVKNLDQKLLASHDVTKAAPGLPTTPSSPKKKNKKKKKKSQKPLDSATNGASSNTEDMQVENGNVTLQTSPGNTLEAGNTHPSTDNTLNASSKNKKKKKKNKGNPQASTGNTGTDSTSDHQGATGTIKKKKNKAKQSQAQGEVLGTPESNEEKEKRTLFVGNVSTKTTRKSLGRFFSKYGKVETVRLRCAAVPSPATTKKQAVIRNTFHEKRDSLTAYVRFTEAAMVAAALQANGAELDHKHLQVDSSQGTTNRNTKLAVFIGNLAFEAEEEALRSHFAGCGEVQSVRIVRDNKLASGKGFGYVNFLSEDAVEMGLQLDGQVFMHRQLRVQRCAKQGKKGIKPRFKTKGKKGLSFMKTKPTAKTTKKQPSFSGKKMIETKKFKKMKAKAKFTKEDRKKKAIAHNLAGGKPKKANQE